MIQTLKDIKYALANVPDELLDNLFFTNGEMSEETIDLCANEGESKYDFPQVFDLIEKEYPQLNEIRQLILNIVKAQEKLDEQKDFELEDAVSSDTFKDEVKSSSFSNMNIQNSEDKK